MKNKTFKRLICFLLAFVVMLSLPLDLQANAVVTESWMVYALITYLAGMGITFTVAGGVDAMIQAMEEKVKDYEQANNITDFYEYMRNRNVRLVPNNNQDPDGNPFFDLFFTASAVEAIQAFVNWLTSEGGWNKGDLTQASTNLMTFTCFIDGVETVGYTSNATKVETSGEFSKWQIDSLGTFLPFSFSDDTSYYISEENFYTIKNGYKATFIGYNERFSPRMELYLNYNDNGTFRNSDLYINSALSAFGYGNDASAVKENAVGLCFITSNNYLFECLVLKDNFCIPLGAYTYNVDPVLLNSSVDIITPEELQEQFPSVDQGVSIADAISVPMGDPSLIEWGNRIEETFIETGTIPQPQPEVITDPDYAPAPSPVPTPVPSPEIEDIDDLGLPTLGDAIFNKFPFSLPKDLKRIAVILNAEPVTPFWEVNLYETLGNRVPFVGDTTIRIDLAEYEALGQISRWASVITFVIFLVIITKGVIRW